MIQAKNFDMSVVLKELPFLKLFQTYAGLNFAFVFHFAGLQTRQKQLGMQGQELTCQPSPPHQ
jgi:hypothetical protein